MTRIDRISARQVLDSRGKPTVEAEVALIDGTVATASVPSGASIGTHEAQELRDRDPARFAGRGVLRAVSNIIEEIAPALVAADPLDQAAIDDTLIRLDGTENKARLGANAILAVSLAVARAAAASARLPLWRYLGGDEAGLLPLPMVNIVSGGLHAARGVDFQDFLVIPVGAASFSDALEMCVAVHAATADVLFEKGLPTLKADEGGFGPPLPSNAAALELLVEAVERAGFFPGEEVAFALDVAATPFYEADAGLYRLASEGRLLNVDELLDLLGDLLAQFPIVAIEDPLAEDDWEGWLLATRRLGGRVQLIGDDLFTTNPDRLRRGIEEGAGNAVLVKMNQIGTLSETLAVVDLARQAGYRTIISARSGETEDPALADLAVASGAGQIKVGSVTQSDRLSKYNQLLRIEESLGDGVKYAGRAALTPTTAPW